MPEVKDDTKLRCYMFGSRHTIEEIEAETPAIEAEWESTWADYVKTNTPDPEMFSHLEASELAEHLAELQAELDECKADLEAKGRHFEPGYVGIMIRIELA